MVRVVVHMDTCSRTEFRIVCVVRTLAESRCVLTCNASYAAVEEASFGATGLIMETSE